jgi:hypothetical protein
MLRKTVLKATPSKPQRGTGEIEIADVASVVVTSEDPDHPVENAFDHSRGLGASEWVAEETGEQSIVLAFDSPHAIRRIAIEVEENEVARSQKVQVLISRDQEFTYDPLLHQGFNFSPGTNFEREQWELDLKGITHLQLRIMPDTAGKACRARLTSLDLW